MLSFFKNNIYTAPALIIGVSMLLGTLAMTGSANRFASKDNYITVNGTSERLVKSDMAKWTITTQARVEDTASGIARMQESKQNILKYLKSKNIDDKNITIGNVSNNQVCVVGSQGYENCALGIAGYNYSLSITVETEDVDKIDTLSKEITTQITDSNLSSNVEYYYNNLKNVRADMLSEATSNALERANSVARAGNAEIGNIVSLSSGVFQVTAKNSVNFDDYGSYDTSAIDKKITATVKANFNLR